MNVEKQTYLNTEQLQSLFEKQGKAVACYGAGSRYGGIRFRLHSKAKVVLKAEFHSIAAQAEICLDGASVCKTANKVSRFEFILSQGDHVFDVDCTSHGGFIVTAEAPGLSEGARYFDRIGGHSVGGETVLYMSNGDRGATSIRRTSNSEEISVLSSPLYDAAYLYDATNGVYTSTVAYITATDGRKKASTYFNRSQNFTVTRVDDVAICDGRTLEAGANYLAAYVYNGGSMRFLRGNHGSRIDTSSVMEWQTPVLRIVSAQKGSVLMLQSRDYVWTALFFHAEGQKELCFTRNTFHYDEIPLCRNRYVAPTATVSNEDGTPTFYYKREDGKLMRMAYGEDPTEVGYQEAYHPGVDGGGYMQYAGELQYQNA